MSISKKQVELTAEWRKRLELSKPGAIASVLGRIIGRRPVNPAERDLADGVATKFEVEAVWVARATERGDEGPILFVGCGETILILVGQWLYALVDGYPDNGFFRSFELVLAPHCGVPLALTQQRAEVLPFAVSIDIDGEIAGRLIEMSGGVTSP